MSTEPSITTLKNLGADHKSTDPDLPFEYWKDSAIQL